MYVDPEKKDIKDTKNLSSMQKLLTVIRNILKNNKFVEEGK